MTHHPGTHTGRGPAPVAGSASQVARRGRLRVWWNAAVAAVGTLGGLVPHVLHHIGALAGTALVAGSGGTVLFGVLGFVATIPMLLRLRRRFCSWWAPVIALAVFVVMFSLSAFVIGPAISAGDGAAPEAPSPVPTEHDQHHG